MPIELVIVIVVAVVAYGVWEARRDRERLSAGPGIAPHPFVPVIDAGGTRVIDLRAAPVEMMATSAGLGWGLEARRPLPPATLCVWVVSDEVLDRWMEVEPIVWVILAARMREGRKQPSPPALEALFVPEGRYTEAQLAGARSAGLMIAHDVGVIGSEGSVRLEEMLALAPAPPTGPRRPELGGKRHGLLDVLDFVWETSDFVFVDPRRASVALLDGLGVFGHVDEALPRCAKDKPLVWVLSPWLLERWSDRRREVLARIATSMRAFGGATQQLAIDGPGADEGFVTALYGIGLRPVDGLLSVEGPAGRFAVPVTEVLRDLQFLFAIPEETRKRIPY